MVGSVKRLRNMQELLKMNIFVFDPNVKTVPKYINRIDDLESFLKRIRILMIHIPLDDFTHNFLNYDNLSLMPKGSIIINTSRGEIINESDLIKLMDSNHIGGCALDVIHHERNLNGRNKSKLLKYSKKIVKL